MKRVLMVSIGVTKGGAERQLSLFLNSYDRTKLKITLALYLNKIEYSVPSDVEIILLNKKCKWDFAFYFKLLRLILSHRYDVINSKISGVNEVIILMSLLSKRKIIVEIRSSGSRMHKYYERLRFLSLFRRKITVVCNSKKACSEIEKYVDNRMKIVYIPNGISVEKFKNVRVQDETFEIGLIGRIDPVKNIETVIKAFSNFILENHSARASLYIIGHKQYFNYYETLKKLIKDMDLENRISIMKPVENVEEWYNRFDLFIMPSHMEGTPNALLEAMCCGCLCLVSKGANSDHFLEDTFQFETINDIELSEKISWIYTMPMDSRNKIRAKNMELVHRYYSVENMVDRYTALFSE